MLIVTQNFIQLFNSIICKRIYSREYKNILFHTILFTKVQLKFCFLQTKKKILY